MLQSSSIGLRTVARRSFATLPRSRPTSIANGSTLKKGSRRGYADVKPAAPVAEAKKPRSFKALKWTWRAAYLTVIGGVVYMGYGVYELRNPEDQAIPDPNKQNLVILGKL